MQKTTHETTNGIEVSISTRKMRTITDSFGATLFIHVTERIRGKLL